MEDSLEVCNDSQEPEISPLPFYPKLSRVLSGVTIALVLTYLEIHHPAPPSDSQSLTGRSSAPVYVDCDLMCDALGVNRRTLHNALYCLATWWRSEQARSAASRSNREFLNPAHSMHGKIKPYSIVGARHIVTNQIFTIRRNYGRINNILTQAGIDYWPQPEQHLSLYYLPESQPSPTTQVEHNLAALLEKASVLGVRNGWTEERKRAQSVKMRAIWEMRKKS